MSAHFEETLSQIADLANKQIKRAANEEEAIGVASNLVHVAGQIYAQLGGPRHAAAQFYAIADRWAGKMVEES